LCLAQAVVERPLTLLSDATTICNAEVNLILQKRSRQAPSATLVQGAVFAERLLAATAHHLLICGS
jgi:hypothetical protein